MLTDSSIQFSLAELFDTLPDSVLYYRAVRDVAGQPGSNHGSNSVIDFRVEYANPAAIQVVAGHYGNITGALLRHNSSADSQLTEQRFRTFCDVLETRQPQETEYFNPTSDKWFSLRFSRAGDGVLSIARQNVTPRHIVQKTEQQRELLNSVLNTPLNTIFVYEAIRDKAGVIQDFAVRLVNERGRTDVLNRLGVDVVGKTLLQINPNSRQGGQFNLFCQIIESGKPHQTEQFYPDANVWYNTSISKLEDSVVVIGNDITAQKETSLEIEGQKALMEAMLEGSLNGLLLLEPVYDSQQGIVDFSVQAANQSVERLTGVSPGRAIGQLMMMVYPGIKEAGYFDACVRTLQTGKPERVESYYRDERGLKGWFDVSVVCQENKVIVTFTNTTKFRRAELQLKQSADDIQAVIDNSQTGIFVFSPVYDESGQHVDFRFKTINRMVAAMVGQTPDVLTGAVASDSFVSYRETGLFDKYRHTYETGEEQRFEINYNVDGFDVWLDVKSIKLNNDVLVTFTDFTDLKQVQLTQEKQADLLNNVLNGSQNGIMSFEAVRDASGVLVDFQFKTVNQASERIVGVALDALMQKTLLSIFPGNVELGLFEQYVNTTETGEPTRTEVYYKADGLDCWLDVSARKLGDGFVVTFTDISVTKRASQTVERSAAELQTVIDTAQTGIFLIGPVKNESGEVIDFRFRVANKMLASYVGQDSTQAAGVLGSTWFASYQTNGLFDRYKRTYETGEQTRFDFHYTSEKVDAWLDIMATRVNDEVLVTFSDFTTLKQLQQQLENSVIDLQRSNRNLEQFAYVASHDLQEPLRKIQQFSDILQTSYAGVLDESGRGMLTRMQSAADRMRTLIKDVLAYSRITTKRENARSLDLNRLIDDVLTDLETVITDKQAIIQFDSLPIIVGDAAQMRQLFQNIISNALKFSKPGVQPELRLTSYTQQGRETGLLLPPADEAKLFYRLELSDNGIGFDPTHADKIFQVFQRLHNRNEYAGTGIGLAIVQKVVENHQGYIRADGKLGNGATFVILLPV